MYQVLVPASALATIEGIEDKITNYEINSIKPIILLPSTPPQIHSWDSLIFNDGQ